MPKRPIEEIVESAYQKIEPRLDEIICTYGFSRNKVVLEAIENLEKRREFIKEVVREAINEATAKSDREMKDILRSIARD